MEQARKYLSGYSSDEQIALICQQIFFQLESFDLEIRRRYGHYLIHTTGKTPLKTVDQSSYKLRCRMSVDQLGLILRAADETRLILSDSLSQVFRSIVPFLATERKKNISWNSMRSSTYHAEEADKELVIKALEKMIHSIKDY
jgi:hypothetical protein